MLPHTRDAWLAWDCADDGLVFDSASGDTHRLEPLAFELFMLLHERPLSFDELVQALFDGADDAGWGADDGRHRVARALSGLARLKLIAGPDE